SFDGGRSRSLRNAERDKHRCGWNIHDYDEEPHSTLHNRSMERCRHKRETAERLCRWHCRKRRSVLIPRRWSDPVGFCRSVLTKSRLLLAGMTLLSAFFVLPSAFGQFGFSFWKPLATAIVIGCNAI